MRCDQGGPLLRARRTAEVKLRHHRGGVLDGDVADVPPPTSSTGTSDLKPER